ncbi:helix-turn-helix domain-containing protein [Algoriphagus zhangzhouensis]|uniref:Helix-turn-helix domain-containing protein n=1 Tax=Algoriphagus zhangzhouensis TaxID=1073327 RepID=A0A1M7Z6K8_9BACT|nr:helix-turn-helix domain-containing protein [Algoriphagus zhangzhouensis]TDY49135.1 helix-turn-helix protein [Algoriphagus zhangzhouensis]SHO60484.1 Helix-turn-helix domain-containing protein [Algoriphagus zhangzhouensis]
MTDITTDKLKLAAQFVNSTSAPIFLTGKAGTGKTTFLRNLAKETHKNYVVVAPTGIAALHARGVTIHSQFLLPLGSFLPVREPEGNYTDQYGFFTQHTLGRKHPLNKVRKSVLRAIDLLVIDEVSMLRADVLDAIDYRLKSAKSNFNEPFGGVQVLLIGDLYQLPPIVRDQEWGVLNRFYNSIHFFEAKALQNSGLVYLELDKIFRQQDHVFIDLLNHLRDNQLTDDDVRLLNKHYKSAAEIQEEKDCITITTHNYKADQINQGELEALTSKTFFYRAEVEGDFPESLYPLPETLELREGAQIMFVKNDSSGMASYFNGKLATVTELSKDSVTVIMKDENREYILRKETWENKKYVLNPDTKELDEDVVGTYSHFPIKLAWAVTVHKSQGLTFDKAIIDVGKAFAPGQVYVALSRLRSLDGLFLRSRIQPNLVHSDQQVVEFSSGSKAHQKLGELLHIHQKRYLHQLLELTFDFTPIIRELNQHTKDQSGTMEFEDEDMQATMPKMLEKFRGESEVTQKFSRQLLYLLHEGDFEKLNERLEKGGEYYRNFLANRLQEIALQLTMVSSFTKTQKIQEELEAIEELILRKYLDISKIRNIVNAVSIGEVPGKMQNVEQAIQDLRKQFFLRAKEISEEKLKAIKSKTGKRKKGAAAPKRQKGDSHAMTFLLFESGKDIRSIAMERGLAESTIKSHMAEGIAAGRFELEDCLPQEVIIEIMASLEKFKTMKELREHFKNKYDYGTLKMVFAGNRDI